CWNLVSLFSPSVFYSTKSFAEKGQSLHRLVDESAVLLTKELAGKDQNGRVELTSSLYNRALVSGLYGTAFYYSVVPETMKELYESLGMAAYTRPYVFKGLEERQALLDLLSVQYETREDKNGKIRLEENKDALPLGYTYTQVMSREIYEKMTPLQRQAALLECAVVDEKEMGRFSERRKISDGIFTRSRSKIQSAKKASFKQGKLKGQKGGFLEIEFETKDDTESYLVLKGFFGVRNQRQEHALYVVQGNQKKEIGISGKKAGSSMKREYIAVNLGEVPAGKHTCRICFAKKVNARLENMEIQSLSADAMKKQNRKRAREAMQDIEISTNQITGNITVSGQRILQLAVPFSKGWTARVDGKKTELFSSGIAYMGLKLEEGEHSIELCYCSPWMREGAVLGILAAAGLVVPFPLSGKRKMRGMKHER
ncbi:MAG: YfhO family protein, partial [Hominisplanchenecus sp.]